MQKDKRVSMGLIGAIIGVITFLLLYGVTPLNVVNDSWILQGYDELDIVQHYAGWLHFRNSRWSFPLMKASSLAYPTGTVVSFTDSIPFVAILFKLFSGVLPETFQYFGIYTLLCYLLQGYYAAKLINHFVDDKLFATCAVPFFTFAPILVERAFRHTALGSQWLILAALVIYFEARDEKFGKGIRYDIGFAVLAVLAIGIHPYFLPMVYGIYFIYMVEKAISNRKNFQKVIPSAIPLLISLIVTVAVGYCLGSLGTGNLMRSGYSAFSMNLNAMWNPSSIGGYKWSLFLKEQNQLPGQYDGFNYLGLGMLFGLCLCVLLILLSVKKQRILSFIKENFFLLALSACYTAFAVTNVITFNSASISVPIPEFIYSLCSIFRASGRIFYPVYYLIVLFVVGFVYRNLSASKVRKVLVIVFVLCLQLGDMSTVILGKHLHFLNDIQSTLLNDEYLAQMVDGKEFLVAMLSADNFELATFAGKKEIPTNISCANTGDYSRAFGYGAEQYILVSQGIVAPDKLYVTTDEAGKVELKEIYSTNPVENIELYETGMYLFVINTGD